MNRVAFQREKLRYRVRMERSIIFALIGHILLFGFSQKIKRRAVTEKKLPLVVLVTEDIVPITASSRLPMAPDLPSIPIPSEDEFLPDRETIDPTELEVAEAIPWTKQVVEIPNVEDLIPQFRDKPDDREEAKTGYVLLSILVNVFGRVDSVRVKENTTGSKTYEEDAIFAAFRTRYELHNSEPVWIERPFYFQLKK